MADATASARAQIRKLLRAPEPEVLAPLLRDAALDAESRARVERRALAMLADLRAAQSRGWVNQFLQEYRLNTQEGVALLSLAEAFLRVPDPDTADSLISDKLCEGDWRSHKGKANSGLVNTATWGLVIGRALTSDSEQASTLKRLVARAGEPFVRTGVGAAMRMMGEIFVMGRDIGEAVARMKKPENKGFTASFDMLGEAARTFPDAERYYKSYEDAIRAVGKVASAGHSISVKLSALHPRYEVAHYDRCVPALIEKVEALASLAASPSMSKLAVKPLFSGFFIRATASPMSRPMTKISPIMRIAAPTPVRTKGSPARATSRFSVLACSLSEVKARPITSPQVAVLTRPELALPLWLRQSPSPSLSEIRLSAVSGSGTRRNASARLSSATPSCVFKRYS